MSAPMTERQWKAQLKKFGVKTEYYGSGWYSRGRPITKGPFNDVHGVVIHHTGGNLHTDASYTKFLFVTGRSDLPAPLCHAEGRADGTIVMGAGGRANHAGLGSSVSLSHVLIESTPYDRELRPSSNNNSTDGNRHFYGLEIDYGRSYDGPTKEQYDSAVAWAAAICDFHKWTGASVIGHREWTYKKSDPARIKMHEFRKAVDWKLMEVNNTLTPAPIAEPDPIVPDTTDPVNHTVVKGDTLWAISQKYNTTVADIKFWNHLTSDVIQVGQVLTIRPDTPPSNLPQVYEYPAEVSGKNWKRTIGTRWSLLEIKRTKLDTYSLKDFYFLNEAKTGVIQRVYHGAKTTSGSKNPRNEGREMNSNGTNEYNWNGLQGEHWSEHIFRINRFTKKKPHTVVHQIHGGGDDVTVFRAECNKDSSGNLLDTYKLWITKGDTSHARLAGTFKIDEVVKTKFHVIRGRIYYYVNDVQVKTSTGTAYYISAKDDSYFKYGAYLQSNPETAPGESTSEYTEVETFKVKTYHS